jgi:hypothetical protein
MKLGFARLSETVGVNDKAVFAIKLPTVNLKEQDFKSIEHLTVFG